MPGFIDLPRWLDEDLADLLGEAHDGVHTPSHAIADSRHPDADRHVIAEISGRFAR